MPSHLPLIGRLRVSTASTRDFHCAMTIIMETINKSGHSSLASFRGVHSHAASNDMFFSMALRLERTPRPVASATNPMLMRYSEWLPQPYFGHEQHHTTSLDLHSGCRRVNLVMPRDTAGPGLLCRTI
jgi:hypothetical protein